jgi:hypothetical protein
MRWTRAIGGSLLGLVFAWQAAAFAPLLRDTAPSSCCTRNRSCCCKKASTERKQASWNSAGDCARRCQVSPAVPSRGGWAPATTAAVTDAAPPAPAAPARPDTPGPASLSDFAFLYQRPPPSV